MVNPNELRRISNYVIANIPAEDSIEDAEILRQAANDLETVWPRLWVDKWREGVPKLLAAITSAHRLRITALAQERVVLEGRDCLETADILGAAIDIASGAKDGRY